MEEEKCYAVRPDLYDSWAYRWYFYWYPPLAKLAAEGKEVLPFFSYLLRDIFCALYKEDVELRDVGELLPLHHPQRATIERLQQQGWLGQFRPVTMLREGEAIIATELIARALLELAQGKGYSEEERRKDLKNLDNDQLGELLRQTVRELAEEQKQEPEPSEAEAEAEAKEEERREIEEEFKSKIEAIAKPLEERCEDAEREKAAPDGEQKQEPEPSEAEAEAEAKEEERREIGEAFKSRISPVAELLDSEEGRGGVAEREKAEKATPEEVEMILGGLEAGRGEGCYYTVDTREEFEEALTWVKKLRHFARALGRLLQTSFKKRLERLPPGAEELYEVESGRDLRRVLASELVKLAHPSFLRKVFWLSYARGDLLLYSLRSRVPLGKGSKIFVIDLSLSLHDEDYVRQGLEKLIAAALLLYSKRGEAFCVIYFQDDPFPPMVELSNPPTAAQWIDLATRFGRGGTDFERPLEEAVTLIEGNPRFRKADIILITDGQPWWGKKGSWWTRAATQELAAAQGLAAAQRFAEWLLSKKKELGFTLVTILLDWRGEIDETQVGFSDWVVKATELLTKEELEEITEIFTGKPIESYTLA